MPIDDSITRANDEIAREQALSARWRDIAIECRERAAKLWEEGNADLARDVERDAERAERMAQEVDWEIEGKQEALEVLDRAGITIDGALRGIGDLAESEKKKRDEAMERLRVLGGELLALLASDPIDPAAIAEKLDQLSREAEKADKEKHRQLGKWTVHLLVR